MDEEGKELTTALHPTGDFLGFSNFTANNPNQESATAIQDVKLAGVSKKLLKEILSKNPGVTLELMELLTGNLAEAKKQLLQLAYSSVRKKTASTLLQFSEILNKRQRGEIKISRNDLASVAGVAAESLIRTLSSFKKEGYLDITRRNIKIIDQNALQNIVRMNS